MLKPGEKIGIYEVVCSLGAGGMGEVYRARDTKLQRDVALKILPEIMARDVQRMGRFEREAQVLASLNHPNIAAIYGLEESNSVRALVMELVEGETLAERIGRPDASVAPGFSPAQSHNAGLKSGSTTGQGRSGVGEGSALNRSAGAQRAPLPCPAVGSDRPVGCRPDCLRGNTRQSEHRVCLQLAIRLKLILRPLRHTGCQHRSGPGTPDREELVQLFAGFIHAIVLE